MTPRIVHTASGPNALSIAASLSAISLAIWILWPHLLAVIVALNIALLGGFALGKARREKKVRRELELSEERLRALFEMAPDGFMLLSAEGRIEMVNHQLERLVGYSREELMGQDVEFVLPVSENDTYLQTLPPENSGH